MLKKDTIEKIIDESINANKYNNCLVIYADDREEWIKMCTEISELFELSNLSNCYIDCKKPNKSAVNITKRSALHLKKWDMGYCDLEWYKREGHSYVSYKSLLEDEIIEF